MDVKFLSQPAASSESLDDFVDALADHDLDQVTIVSAWAKRSGLGRVASRLRAFRDSGGTVRMIVGVSEGGATREGLELVIELSDDAFVFHDPRRTFHPKVYMASGHARRELLVGSSNMTAGGLGWNHEASLWISETGTSPSQVYQDADQWISNLLVQPMSCKRLDSGLLSDLLSSSDIRIGSESAARRVSVSPDAPEDSDSQVTGAISGLFSAPAMVMRPLRGQPSSRPGRALPASPAPSSSSPSAGSSRTSAAAVPALPPVSSAPVSRRWFRELDNTAAQQVLSPNSNPTGNLRLSQAGHGINHATYFRDDMFGGLPWSPTPSKLTEQEVVVDFECEVGGVRIGIVPIRISHDPARISSQANVPSVLHWGQPIGGMLRASSYIGQFISIERLADESFTLTISQSPTGPFVA